MNTSDFEIVLFDSELHSQAAVAFKRDAYVCSFGDATEFGTEEDHLAWLTRRANEYTNGFLILLDNSKKPVGQIESYIKKDASGERFGTLSLIYVIPELRGLGVASIVFNAAIEFFQQEHVKYFILQVSATNSRAIAYYKKMGLQEVRGPDAKGLLDMRGPIPLSASHAN